jgi:alanine racemase
VSTQARTWAEVDLSAISNNLRTLRDRVPEGTRLLAVVKANAYGHGAVPVARHLLREGVDRFGVNDVGEAVELREGGVGAPILLLGAIFPEEIEEAVARELIVSVHDAATVELLEAEAARQHRNVTVHFKVDTGLGRLGVPLAAARAVARRIAAAPHLRFEGLYTHFSSSSPFDLTFTRVQLKRFEALLGDLAEEGVRPPVRHVANSASIFSALRAGFEWVRPGIALYGLNPVGALGHDLGLRPALALRTRVAAVRDLAAGAPVGYNQRWFSQAPTRLATLPIGYHDGFPFALSGTAYALLRGRKVPVVGAISMDCITVDAGIVPDARPGDVATLIGSEGAHELPAEALAQVARTIPYQITSCLGRRVQRVYRGREEPRLPLAAEAAPAASVAQAVRSA